MADEPRTFLELRVNRVQQMFNSMDPAPFRERDLDPQAVGYIVDWATQHSRSRVLGLRIQVAGPPAEGETTEAIVAAVRANFARMERASQLDLRRLFRTGRVSLCIGLAFLSLAIIGAEHIASTISLRYAGLISESFAIGGWVALWRPLEIFLYDWWPIAGRVRMYRRLASMNVVIEFAR